MTWLLSIGLLIQNFPGYGRWLALHGRIVWLGATAGYAAAAVGYLPLGGGVRTVVRWEQEEPEFRLLQPTPLALFFVPVQVSDRRLYVSKRDLPRLREAFGSTPGD